MAVAVVVAGPLAAEVSKRLRTWVDRLELTAEREATALARAGALGVALTGSLARGDPSLGSDVDLWVIGRRNRRRHFERAGVPVTIIEESVSTAFSMDAFARVEVDEARVLYDPLGVFARLGVEFRRHRRAARRRALDALRESIVELEAAAQEEPQAVLRLLIAREALMLRATRTVFSAEGPRAVKFRHLASSLSPSVVRLLSGALGLGVHSAASVRRSLLVLTPGRRTNNALQKLDHGAVEEGIVLARREVLLLRTSEATLEGRLRALTRWWLRSPNEARHLRILFGLSAGSLRRQLDAASRAAVALPLSGRR